MADSPLRTSAAGCSSPSSSSGKCRASTSSFFVFRASNASGRIRTSDSWYERNPVPAGTRWPRITFSLSPTRLSVLPANAASVSTLVVSWKLAAEMKLELCTAALVIPNSWVEAVAKLGFLPLAGWPLTASICEFTCSRATLGTIAPTCKSLSPGSVIFTQSSISLLAERKSYLSMTTPGSKPVSPTFSTANLRSICETMISICLSLISTRWLR